MEKHLKLLIILLQEMIRVVDDFRPDGGKAETAA